jgi:toxin-antitoxin system PIN domain toxin
MLALDTNVLIQAHRAEMPLNVAAFELIEGLSGSPWVIPWPCVHEFLGQVTNRRRFANPSRMTDALDQLAAWQDAGAYFLGEGHDHLERLTDLVTTGQVSGPMVHDARIAAICLSHGVSELLTLDRDFSRFPALRVRNPLM